MTQRILQNAPGNFAMRKNTTPQKSRGKKRSDLPPGFLRAGGWGVGGGTMSELGPPGDGDPPPCRRHGSDSVIVDSERPGSMATMAGYESGRRKPAAGVGRFAYQYSGNLEVSL